MEVNSKIRKCRTCLSLIEISSAISLFNKICLNAEENICISNMIMSCASVQIADDDSFPNSICKTCLEDAKIAYLFKHKCEEAHKLLTDLQIPELDINTLVKVEVLDEESFVQYESDESQPLSTLIGVQSKNTSTTNYKPKQIIRNKQVGKLKFSYTKYSDTETRKELKCKHCRQKFRKIGSLRNHISRKHSNNRNASNCDKDNRNDDSSNIGHNIDAINPNKVNYTCCQCNETFSNEHELISHRNTHTSFNCNGCNSTFLLYNDYELHTEHCSQINDKSKDIQDVMKQDSYECENCCKIYQTELLLRRHIHVCRAKSSYPCLSCPEVFASYKKLLEHRKIHRSVDCKYCGLKVVRKLLIEHVSTTHSGAQFCIECRQCFETYELLDEHYKTHTEYCCKNCGSSFNEIMAFTEHLDTHKFEQLHQESNACINCEKVYSNRKQLLRHYKTHTEFTCNECELIFNTALNLLKHAESHETEDDASVEERTCAVCNKQFKIVENMWKHRAAHNSDKSEVLYCPYCDFKPKNKILLGTHMQLDHDSHKTIFCSVCNKSFFCPRKLKMHMLTHTGEKRHVCDVCGRGFTLGGNLITHMRTHTGEKPYKCEICGKGFAQNSALKSHMVFHKPSNDHVCPECGVCFSRLGVLRLHMRSHSDERPYGCSVCQKAFKGKRELKMHEHIHTGIKGFTCNYCGKAFGRKSSLVVHERIHTGETPHVCTVCGKGFIQLHVLRTHMNTHGS